jgi:cytochrome b
MMMKTVKVWDPVVRLGHWVLVIAFFTAYFTEDAFLTQHVWAGYVVGGVVLFRIFWGLGGTGKYARFSNFIYAPKAIFGYLKGLAQGKPQHYVGHNPAGGAMVMALLLSLCGTVFTGLNLYAVEENAGPLAQFYAAENVVNPALPIISQANASEAEEHDHDEGDEQQITLNNTMKKHVVNEQDEEFWEELHEFFANFTLLLVALHVLGVFLSSYIDKENLLKAMITGKKEVE